MTNTQPDVTLREVTKETVRTIIDLDVGPGQDNFVAPNSVSIAQAHFEPKAWFRAAYADEEPVGFVMLHEDRDKAAYGLWRLMIDHRHQGKGYGRRIIELVIDHVRTLPDATELKTSYIPGDGSPGPFYHRLGFVDNGEVHGEEIVSVLQL